MKFKTKRKKMIQETEINSFNIKYFSHLDINQKQKTYNYLRIFINGLQKLPYNLAMEILKNMDLDDVIKENEFIDEKIKGQKVFRELNLKTYFPLNFKEIINYKKLKK